MFTRYTALVAVSIVSQPALADERVTPAKRRALVYTLQSAPSEAPLARRLTEEILVHLGQRKDIAVLGEAEVNILLEHVTDHRDLDDRTCERDEECLARIGRAAEAELAISGRVDRLGTSFVVTTWLVSSEEMIVEGSESCTAESEAELVPVLLEKIDAMLGFSDRPRPQPFSLDGNSGATKVAVVPLSGLEREPEIAASLTQIYGLELRRLGLSVITRDEISAAIDFRIDQHCLGSPAGESDLVACLAEIGGALGVDYLAAGAIGRFDETHVIILKLIDIRRVEVVRRVSESYRGPLAHLPRAVRFATGVLLGRTGSEETGELTIATDVDGKLGLDSREPIALPLAGPVTELSAHKHALSIVADGYHPYYSDIYVEPGPPLRFEPELIAKDRWYTSWWFLSLAGIAVAGATAATLIVTLSPSGAGGEAAF